MELSQTGPGLRLTHARGVGKAILHQIKKNWRQPTCTGLGSAAASPSGQTNPLLADSTYPSETC